MAELSSLLPNPMPFLREYERGEDRSIDEALFLTFNADLGFFESALLGLVQSLGGVTTVIADASVWEPDMLAARRAGRLYHLGLAQTTAAFHPKLSLFLGKRTCLIGIGSGNLTAGGWQHNAELWTVLEGASDGTAPALASDLADWLERLPDAVPMDRLSSHALRRCASALRKLMPPASGSPGPRLLHNLDTPLIDQLPHGPVDELALHAPFHDPQAAAVRALQERLRPRQIRLLVQPGYTVLDPAALDEALDTPGTRISILADPESPGAGGRYRHGKLIEWAAGGTRCAITGSPNLSSAALLRTPASGGNCELALLHEVSRSLMPPGSPVDASQIPTITITGSRNRYAGPVGMRLIAATATPNGVTVEFAAPLKHQCRLEIAASSGALIDWTLAGTAGVGDRESELAIDPPPRSGWLRAAGGDGNDDWAGSPVPITDKTTALRPPLARAQRRTQRATPQELLNDIPLLDELSRDLERLAAELSNASGVRAPVPAGEGGQGGPQGYRLDTDSDPWHQEVYDASRTLGAHVAAFALGLPTIPDPDFSGEWHEDTVVDRFVGDGEEPQDSDPVVEDDSNQQDPPTDHRGDADALRRQRRNWSKKAAAISPRLTLASQLVLLRLVVNLYTAGNWSEDDDEPFHLIGEQLGRLRTDGASDRMRASAASLTAVALAVLRDRTDLTQEVGRTLAYRSAVAKGRDLLSAADPDLAEEYVRHLQTPYDSPMDPQSVMETALGLTADPLADVISGLEQMGDTVSRAGDRQLLVNCGTKKPGLSALRAVGLAQNHAPVAVWTINTRLEWALALWDGTHLALLCTSANGTRRWQVWKPSGLLRPSSIFHALATNQRGNIDRIRIRVPPHQVLPPEVAHMLDMLGINELKPPSA